MAATNQLTLLLKLSGVAQVITGLNQLTEITTKLANFAAKPIRFIAGAIDAADEVGKMAERVNFGVEALSRLTHAAQINNVQTSQLETGLKMLNKQIAEAASNAGSTAADAFRAIGVAVLDANGKLRSNQQIFLELADKFSSFEDSAAKGALAMHLFGRSGADMLPLLNQGAQAIRSLGSEIEGVTDGMAKDADTFNDNLFRIRAAFTDVGVRVARDLLPYLAEFSAWLVKLQKDFGFFSAVAGTIVDLLKTLATGVRVLIFVFQVLGKTIGSAAAIVSGVYFNAIRTAIELGQLWIGNLKEIGKLLLGIATRDLKLIKESVGALGSDAKASLDLIAGAVAKTFNESKAIAEGAITDIKDELAALTSFALNLQAPPTPAAGEGELSPRGTAPAPLLTEEAKTAKLKEELDKRSALQIAFDAGNVQSFIAAQESIVERERFALQQRQELLSAYQFFWQESHRSMFSYVAQAATTLYQGLSNAITGIITGTVKAAEAFKQLGLAMVNMVVQFIVQRGIAFALEKVLAASGLALAKAHATAVAGIAASMAAAWAPAATAALIATFGGAASNAALLAPLMAANSAAASSLSLAGALGGALHGGLNFVPQEQTFLLQRGERVVQPEANQDLTDFLDQQRTGQNLEVTIHLDGRALAHGLGEMSRDGRLTLSARSIV